jgi:hypothetical protein
VRGLWLPRAQPRCSTVALVFTPEERGRLRDALIAADRVDERISGAALTGSASLGAEDRWSGVSPYQGRGMDELPPEAAATVAAALVRALAGRELRRAFRVVIHALHAEITYADLELAARLADTLQELATGTDTR